jgi:ABC-2 type transport system permease protein
MLSGIMFPVNMLPKVLEKVGKIFPATWGFELMANNTFEVRLIIPLLVITLISVCISGYRLSKIGLE